MDDFVIEVIVEEGLPELAGIAVEGVLKTAVLATLLHENAQPPLELSLLLTNDEQIRQLNWEYRQEDKPTDVLSFPAGEAAPGVVEEVPYLGDIAISAPYAARQAAQADHDLPGELQLLAVHGVLHLLGYDHETAEEKQEMWAAQTAVLAQLNLQHITPTET
jgi:probable rRNA maturation factor